METTRIFVGEEVRDEENWQFFVAMAAVAAAMLHV